MTIQQRTPGERKFPLIHSSDGKKNTRSSCVKVQILNKELKKITKWGQGGGKGYGCVDVWVCVYGGMMSLLTVMMVSRDGVLQTNSLFNTVIK